MLTGLGRTSQWISTALCLAAEFWARILSTFTVGSSSQGPTPLLRRPWIPGLSIRSGWRLDVTEDFIRSLFRPSRSRPPSCFWERVYLHYLVSISGDALRDFANLSMSQGVLGHHRNPFQTGKSDLVPLDQ